MGWGKGGALPTHCLWDSRRGGTGNYKDRAFGRLLLYDSDVLKKENHIVKLASHEPQELCESQDISLAAFKGAFIF